MNGNFLQSLGLPPELQQFLAQRSTQELQPSGSVINPNVTDFPSTEQILRGGWEAPISMSAVPPANVMQAAVAPPEMLQAPQPSGLAGMENDLRDVPDPAPPRQRRSLLDTIGRVSDAFARFGGHEPGYQPTLDAREDREIARGDHELRRTLTRQQIGAGTDEATGRQEARLGRAVRGLQAIQARGGDTNVAWPLIARQAGIPEDRAAQLGEIFSANPQAIGGFATMLGGDQPEFGVQPFYAQDANGTLRAYQLGRDGTVRPIQLGEGESPIDPLTFVDTGGNMVGVGQRSGRPRRILPRTERPGYTGGQPDNERPGFSGGRPTAPDPRGQGRTNPAMVEAARGNLTELRSIYGQLRQMGALVSPSQSTGGNIIARVRASGPGQIAEGAVGTQAQTLRDRITSIRPALMQAIAQATGMTGRQLDSNADVRLFMQTVTNPTSSYEANLAAIAGLERFMAANARGQQQAPAAPRAAPRRATPRVVPRTPRGGGSPQLRMTPARPGGGWGRATVVER